MTPGAIEEYQIEVMATANLFRKGHRICLDITSLDLPTGVAGATNAEYVPYHICSSKTVLHKIYHDRARPFARAATGGSGVTAGLKQEYAGYDLKPVPPHLWHLTFLSPCLRRPLPSQFLHFAFGLLGFFCMCPPISRRAE